MMAKNMKAVPIPVIQSGDSGVQLRPILTWSGRNGVTATWKLKHATQKVCLALL